METNYSNTHYLLDIRGFTVTKIDKYVSTYDSTYYRLITKQFYDTWTEEDKMTIQSFNEIPSGFLSFKEVISIVFKSDRIGAIIDGLSAKVDALKIVWEDLRRMNYPPVEELADAVVKSEGTNFYNPNQLATYVSECESVKVSIPHFEEAVEKLKTLPNYLDDLNLQFVVLFNQWLPLVTRIDELHKIKDNSTNLT